MHDSGHFAYPTPTKFCEMLINWNEGLVYVLCKSDFTANLYGRNLNFSSWFSGYSSLTFSRILETFRLKFVRLYFLCRACYLSCRLISLTLFYKVRLNISVNVSIKQIKQNMETKYLYSPSK